MKNDAKGKPPGSAEHPLGKSETEQPDSELKRLAILAAVFVLALVIWLIPAPSGVEPRAWHLLAIFVATIVGIIVKPLPMGAIALFGIAATALCGSLTINFYM
jgi:DASS family divalent anion:Na+ symporter